MKKSIRMLALALALILAFGMLAACGGETTPSAAPSTAPSAAPDGEPSAEPSAAPEDNTVYTLKLSTTRGENTWFAQMYNDMAAELEESSNGRLKLEIYHNNTLGAPADIWTMFTQGAIDMLDMSPGMIGSFTVSNILNVPFYLDGNQETADAMWALLDSGLMPEYTDNMKVLMFLPSGGVELFTAKGAVESMSDLSGLKLCGSSAMMAKCIEALGGTAVSTQPSEQVMSLTQGVLDGVITGANFAEIMSLYEAGKYMMRYNIAMSCMFLGINPASYDKLPADLQQLLIETCEKWGEYYMETVENEYDGVLERLAAKGGEHAQRVGAAEGAKGHQVVVHVRQVARAVAGEGADVEGLVALGGGRQGVGRLCSVGHGVGAVVVG